MTPLHHAIKSRLLPICLEINQKERDKEPKDKEKLKKGKALREAIIQAGESHNINKSSNFSNFVLSAISLALNMPELLESKKDYFPPLSVLVLLTEDDTTSGVIVLHGEQKIYLDSQGEISTFQKHVAFASDEIIENTLDNLNGEQLKFILRSPVFEPFLADLFEQTTELVPATAEISSSDDSPF